MEHSEILSSRLSASYQEDSRLQREAELLRVGLSSGAASRITEIINDPLDTAAELSVCAAIGLGLGLANYAGGRWAIGAKIVGTGLAIAFGADVLRRAVPTASAMADTWQSSSGLERNKEIVAFYAGSALVDYPLTIAAGYAGSSATGAAIRARTFFTKPLVEPALPQLQSKSPFGANSVLSDFLKIDRAPADTIAVEGTPHSLLEITSVENSTRTDQLFDALQKVLPSECGKTPIEKAAYLSKFLRGVNSPPELLFNGIPQGETNIPAEIFNRVEARREPIPSQTESRIPQRFDAFSKDADALRSNTYAKLFASELIANDRIILPTNRPAPTSIRLFLLPPLRSAIYLQNPESR